MHVVFQTHNGGELWLGGIACSRQYRHVAGQWDHGDFVCGFQPASGQRPPPDRLWNTGWDRSHDQLVTAQGAGSLLDSPHLGRRPQRQEGACELQEWSSPQCYGDGDVVDGLEPGER